MKKLLLTLFSFLLLAQPSAAEDKILYMYNWSTYAVPELLDKFEKDTGIKVVVDTYDSNQTLLAKLQAGGTGYDIVFPNTPTTEIMLREGLLQKINGREMPNFKHLGERFYGHPYDPSDEYSLPYTWGTSGFAVDTDVYKGEIVESWDFFFNPPKELQGKIGVLNEIWSVFPGVMAFIGSPTCEDDPEALKKAQDVLLAQKPYVLNYMAAGYQERMAAGDVAMQMGWSGDVYKVRQEHPSWVYVYPKEGFENWIDRMAVPVDAQNVDHAKTFMNWAMDPENAAMIAQLSGYMVPNKNAAPFLPEELANAPEFNIPEGANPITPPACSHEILKNYDKIFTRLLR